MNNIKFKSFIFHYIILLFIPIIIALIQLIYFGNMSFDLFISYFGVYYGGILNWGFYIGLLPSFLLNVFVLMFIKFLLIFSYTNIIPESKYKIKYILTFILLFEELIFGYLFMQTVMFF